MWRVAYHADAQKALDKMGNNAREKIIRYMRERIEGYDDPRRFGKALQYELKGLWRYRVGDYRIICKIKDHELIVLVVEVDHRKDVYE